MHILVSFEVIVCHFWPIYFYEQEADASLLSSIWYPDWSFLNGANDELFSQHN